MEKPRKRRFTYQFSLRGLLMVSAALFVSCGLLRRALLSVHTTDGFLFALGAAILLGAAIGAPVGHAFDDERGGAGLMGPWLGAVAAAVLMIFGVALLLLFELLTFGIGPGG